MAIQLFSSAQGAASTGPPSESSGTILKSPPQGANLEPIQTGKIVRHIPDGLWTAQAEADIIGLLEEEMQRAEAERGEFISKLARWKRVYDSPLPEGPKNWPFMGAANMRVPVVKEILNTLVAQLIQATMTARPQYVMKDLAVEWEPFVDELERFMDIASIRDLKLPSVAPSWIIEMAKLGTGILETVHEVDVRRIYKYASGGKRMYPSERVFHDGPLVRHIPLQSFWIRFNEIDHQKAQWTGREFWSSLDQLRAREEIGQYYGVDRIEQFYRDREDDEVKRASQQTEKTEPTTHDPYQIFEIFLSFDIDKDRRRRNEELRLFYHRDSRTIIGRQFNPYWHSRRPYSKAVYFPKEHRFYGIGLCEMLEGIQNEITSIRNRRADNATLANTKMFLKKQLVRGLQPGDPLYPLKTIVVNDPFSDVRELNLSDIYPSTVTEESIAREYAERLSGVNDAVIGSAMPVSRTTAAAQIALLQEQAKRIDLTVRDIRKGLNEVGQTALELYHQYGTGGKALAWLGRRGLVVDAIFRLPRFVAELGLAIEVSTPTSLQNRQVKRENSIAAFNLLVQLYREFLPLAQAMAPEDLPSMVQSMAKSARKFMENVLETFEVSDPEDILAGIAVLEKVLPAPEDLGGLQAFRSGAQSSEILDQLARVENLYSEAQGIREGEQRSRRGSDNGRRLEAPEGPFERGDSGSFLGGELAANQ